MGSSTVIIMLALVTFAIALAGAIIDLRRTPRPAVRSRADDPNPAVVAHPTRTAEFSAR